MYDNLNLTNKQKVTVIVLLLIILVLIVYWPVQNYEFVNYDDNDYVTKNLKTQSGVTLEGIADAFTDISTSNWHPLTMISHILDWQLFGDRAGGHHWTSVIIHIFNTILLFIFLKMITGAVWRSAFVAALFALHPINVESVAWIAERKNVLSTFFWMTTMLFYVWYVRNPGWKRYLPVILSFALGLMSKPMLVTLPFVLLLLDYWPLNRTKIIQQNEEQTTTVALAVKKEKISFLILEKIPLFVLSAVSICLTLYAAGSVKTISTLEYWPASNRINNAVISYSLYIKKLFWPFDLAVFYPHWQIPLWQIFVAALMLLIVTLLVCKYFRRFSYLPVGWFWYLGTLVPVIGIVQVGSQSMADRYAYIPFIGLFIIITWGISDALKKLVSVKATTIIFTGMLVVLMIFTHFQVRCWENSYTLYKQAIRVTKENILPHKNIGHYLIENNRPGEAAYHYHKATELKKNDPTLHNSLGVALTMMGKNIEAEKEYKIALRLQPTHTRAHNNLGVVLMRLGKVDEAAKHFREAIKLEPEYANAHFQLAKILKQKEFDKEATFHFQEAIRINPEFKDKD